MLLTDQNMHSISARYRMKPVLCVNKFVARMTYARHEPRLPCYIRCVKLSLCSKESADSVCFSA